MKNIKPTDNDTLAKIITFAADLDHRVGGTIENSPRKATQPAMNKSQSSKNMEQDFMKTMSGLVESRVSMQTSLGRVSSVFEKTKFEKMMIHKMAYEWKNIYRMLSVIDQKGLGIIPISEFQSCCEKCKVSIVPLEQKQLMKQFGVAHDKGDLEAIGLRSDSVEASELLNYKRLSIKLGLHKDSFNYLNKV